MSGWDYCYPEVETLAPSCDEEWFALPEYQRAHLHLYAVASVGAPEEQVQGLWDAICRRWPHPCYLGASYLNCGWSWIHECQEYGAVGDQVCCDWQYWYRGACCADLVEIAEDTWREWWPHPCQGWEVLPTATYGGRATLGLCWAP